MGRESERDYFINRAAIERVAAGIAVSRNAKAIHLELAQRYELLAVEEDLTISTAEQTGFHAEREAAARAAALAAKTRADKARYLEIAYEWTAFRLAEDSWAERLAAKAC